MNCSRFLQRMMMEIQWLVCTGPQVDHLCRQTGRCPDGLTYLPVLRLHRQTGRQESRRRFTSSACKRNTHNQFPSVTDVHVKTNKEINGIFRPHGRYFHPKRVEKRQQQVESHCRHIAKEIYKIIDHSCKLL